MNGPSDDDARGPSRGRDDGQPIAKARRTSAARARPMTPRRSADAGAHDPAKADDAARTPGTALDWLEQVRDRAVRVRELRESAEAAARSALDACDRALESLRGWRRKLEARKEELRATRPEEGDGSSTPAAAEPATSGPASDSSRDASITPPTSFEESSSASASSVEGASSSRDHTLQTSFEQPSTSFSFESEGPDTSDGGRGHSALDG